MPGFAPSVSYVKGIHNIKAGVTYEQTFLTENDTFGIVDPDIERGVPQCRRQSPTRIRRSPIQAQCTGALQPNLGQRSASIRAASWLL